MSSKVVHAREAKLRGTEYALLAARPEAGRQAPVRWLLAPAVAAVQAPAGTVGSPAYGAAPYPAQYRSTGWVHPAAPIPLSTDAPHAAG